MDCVMDCCCFSVSEIVVHMLLVYQVVNRTMNSLNIETVAINFGSDKIIDSGTIEVRPSEVIGLLGKNGSGKTSILKAIVGLLRSTGTGVEGTINGQALQGRPTADRIRLGLRYLPQSKGVFSRLTVSQQIRLAKFAFGDSGLTTDAANSLIGQLDPKIPIEHLSGGQQRLLAISSLLLGQPRYVLLDEPFAGLSPESTSLVTKEINRIAEHLSVGFLVAENRSSILLGMCSKVFSIKHRTLEQIVSGPVVSYEP